MNAFNNFEKYLNVSIIQAVLDLDPENKSVPVEAAKAKKLIADAKAKEKARYGNMFSKVSVYDDKGRNNRKSFAILCYIMQYYGI